MPASVLGAILLAALLHAAWNAALKAQPDTFVATLAVSTGSALLGGLASTGSYGIVLWAMTQAPVAVVAALRETSIVFALAIAVFILGERASRARLCGAALVALGAAAIKLAWQPMSWCASTRNWRFGSTTRAHTLHSSPPFHQLKYTRLLLVADIIISF